MQCQYIDTKLMLTRYSANKLAFPFAKIAAPWTMTHSLRTHYQVTPVVIRKWYHDMQCILFYFHCLLLHSLWKRSWLSWSLLALWLL